MQGKKGVVSLLTPCFNGEKHIFRLLDSVLEQDYLFIEHIIIDDGSTDGTKDIIEKYIPLYNEKGYTLVYVYQENQGQSFAVNRGLKLISGEFFAWPDADDFYASPLAISTMVKVLSSSDQKTSMVRCLATYVEEGTLTEMRKTPNIEYGEYLFEDCLLEQNGFWYLAGGYMCRVETLFKAIPDKEIYTEKNAGQNWQLMLPLLYRGKCITIYEYLYKVLERKNSHSREMYVTLERVLTKIKSYEDTVLGTLLRLNLSSEQRKKYIDLVKSHFDTRRFYLVFYQRDKYLCKYYYSRVFPKSFSLNLAYILSYIPLGAYIYRGLKMACVIKDR